MGFGFRVLGFGVDVACGHSVIPPLPPALFSDAAAPGERPMSVLPNVAFIGGGNMATATIKGLVALPNRPTITVVEPDAAKHAALAALGCRVVTDAAAALPGAGLVVLAIKPQVAAQVVPALAAAWPSNALLVSILAGTTTAKLAGWLPAGARVVRAMPNLPLAVGKGMVGLCRGASATAEDLALAEALFAPCAKVLKLADESRMDAITAVSGSGPAYFFRFAEALVAGAEKLGFTREEAVLLVGQTGAGSWDYLMESGFEAEKLRIAVTSPGGTTAAALKTLDDGGFMALWADALAAAERRGRELAG
jgi:pyrroline-5-carboxylate reductase